VPYPLTAGAWSYVIGEGASELTRRVELVGPGYVVGSSELLAAQAIAAAIREIVDLGRASSRVWMMVTSATPIEQIVRRSSFQRGAKGRAGREAIERIHDQGDELGDELDSIRIVRVSEPCVREAARMARGRLLPLIEAARPALRARSTRASAG
jgi:hypothetical protein